MYFNVKFNYFLVLYSKSGLEGSFIFFHHSKDGGWKSILQNGGKYRGWVKLHNSSKREELSKTWSYGICIGDALIINTKKKKDSKKKEGIENSMYPKRDSSIWNSGVLCSNFQSIKT